MSSKETASDKFKDWFYESCSEKKERPVHDLDDIIDKLSDYIEALAEMSYVSGYEQALKGDSNESD